MTHDVDRPCEDWCTVDDAEAIARARHPGNLDQETLAVAIDVASAWLYRLSGRQYSGECTGATRPIPFVASGVVKPRLGERRQLDRRSRRLEGALEIDLDHSPIKAIDGVWVNGALVAASAYRVDDDRWLVRIDGEGWPNHQNWTLDPKTDTNSGMVVEFTWGTDPPPDGKLAAIVLAAEVTLAFLDDPSCRLPANLSTMSREGTNIALADAQPFLEGSTFGIRDVDKFIRSVNPNGRMQRPRVLNPDYPRKYRRQATDVEAS